MIKSGNPNTILQEDDVNSSGVPLYGMYKNPTINDMNAPRVMLNSDMTPRGPEITTGAISEMNMGHKTEKAPAANP